MVSNSAATSASGLPYPVADSNSRAPSRWTAAPRSLAHSGGHRSAGQVEGGRLAEQPGDLDFEFGDYTPLAVAVGHRVRGDAGQQVGRPHRAMPGQEHGALVA